MTTVFNVISILYGITAVFVLIRVIRDRRAIFDDDLTESDRRFARATAFYLAVPFAVALHELGHAATTWALGGRIVDFGYAAYWGYVVPERVPPFTPGEGALISAAGNIVSILLGLAAVFWTLRRPSNAARNIVRLEFARIQLELVLFLYPAMSLLGQFGDFELLRRDLNLVGDHFGDAALVAYGALAVGVLFLWRKRWRHRYALLVSPLLGDVSQARLRLATDPQDLAATEQLARGLVALGDYAGARAALTRLVADRGSDPELRLLLGVTALAAGDAASAIPDLELALGMARDRDELRLEIFLALSQAHAKRGNLEGALEAASSAHALAPRETRALLAYSDALAALQRGAEAEQLLEAALARAQDDEERFALRRRLEELPRRR